MKRVIVLLICTAFLLTCILACNNKKKITRRENIAPITLKVLLPGKGDITNSATVYEAFNNYIKKQLPDIQVDFEIVNKYDYSETLKTYLNAEKQFDIAWNCDEIQPYLININHGQYKVLDTLIKNHGKDILSSLPQECIDLITINNHIYYLPALAYDALCEYLPYLIIPKKYQHFFDIDGFCNEISKNGLNEKAYQIIDNYLASLRQNGAIENGVDYIEVSKVLPYINHEFIMSSGRHLGYSHKEPDKIINLKTTARYKLATDNINQWIANNYIKNDYYLTGKHKTTQSNNYILSAAKGFKNNSGINFVLSDDISNDYMYLPLDTEYYKTEYILNGIIFISTHSAYPEQAVKLVNLFYKDSMLNRIITEGLDANGNKISDYSMYPNILPCSEIISTQADNDSICNVKSINTEFPLYDFTPGIWQLNQILPEVENPNSKIFNEIISELNQQAESHIKEG